MERIAHGGYAESPASQKKTPHHASPLAAVSFAAASLIAATQAQAQAGFAMPGDVPGTPGISNIGVPGVARFSWASGIDYNGTWASYHVDFRLTRNENGIEMTQLTAPIREPHRNNGMYLQPDGKGGVTTIEVDAEMDPAMGGRGATSDLFIDGESLWDQPRCINKGPFSLFPSQQGKIGINQGYNAWNAFFIDKQTDCFEFENAIANGKFNAEPPVTNHVLSTDRFDDAAFLNGERVVIVGRYGGPYWGTHFALAMPNGQEPLYVGRSGNEYSTAPENTDPLDNELFLPDGTNLENGSFLWAAGEIPLAEGAIPINTENPVVLLYGQFNGRFGFEVIERIGDVRNPLPSDTIVSVPISPVIAQDIHPQTPDYDNDGVDGDEPTLALNDGETPAQATCFAYAELDRFGFITCESTDNGFAHAVQHPSGSVLYYDTLTVQAITPDETGRESYQIQTPADANQEGAVVADFGWQQMNKAGMREIAGPVFTFENPPQGFAYTLEMKVDVTTDLHHQAGAVELTGAAIINNQGAVIDAPMQEAQNYEFDAGAFSINFNGASYAPLMRVTLRAVDVADAAVAVPDAAMPDAAVPDASVPDSTVHDATSLDAETPDTSVPDAAAPDVALPDAAVPDATAIPDATIPDAVMVDSVVPDAASPLQPDLVPVDAAVRIIDAQLIDAAMIQPNDAFIATPDLAPLPVDAGFVQVPFDAASIPDAAVLPLDSGAILADSAPLTLDSSQHSSDSAVVVPDTLHAVVDATDSATASDVPAVDATIHRVKVRDIRIINRTDGTREDPPLSEENSGCDCSMQSNSPATPLMLLTTAGIIAARRRRRSA